MFCYDYCNLSTDWVICNSTVWLLLKLHIFSPRILVCALTPQSLSEYEYSNPVAVDSHTHSPFPTAAVCEIQMKQRYSWLLSMNIKTWTSCPGHSISHSGQCVCGCVPVCVCVLLFVCECKLLPCLSSQPQLRARLKHQLKANQVTADGVRTRAVHSLVCVFEEKRELKSPFCMSVLKQVCYQKQPLIAWQFSCDVNQNRQSC